ncbi:MAG: ribose-phosphate pyrophosphokinase [Thermotogae bacterium]|nr:ribose-phosphate pyrophosphokinase [Thermotogota bacterium]
MEIKILGGNANPVVLEGICSHLGIAPTKHFVGRFSDGEIRVQIEESVRGQDVYLVQSTNPPAENLLELLLLADAARRASAARITAVIPYFGYARQDRKDRPRVPISAKLVANLIEAAGIDRILTVDLHADQIQGFFNIPVDNLYATPIFKRFFLEDFEEKISAEKWVVVSPDVGGIKRARLIAEKLWNLPLAMVDKRRPRPNVAQVVSVIGEVEGKNVLLVDDIIDTGNTIANASKALIERGALRVLVMATHGLFSGRAREVLGESPIERILITNTVFRRNRALPEKTQVLDVSGLLAEAIKRIHSSGSISALFL